MVAVTKEKAFIFRITHLDNVPAILDGGIICRSVSGTGSTFRDIGNKELIQKRSTTVVPIKPGGTLSDYVPFYFTPHSPMLLNIKTGYSGVKQTPMSEIAILVTSLHELKNRGIPFVFTDRHALLRTAQFSGDLSDLAWIDWGILQRRDFKRDPNDLGKVERYQAEALVHKFVPVTALLGIACYGATQAGKIGNAVKARGLNLKVETTPGWYF